MVSRRHAVIEYRGSQYFLRDCNSSNGSLVNGDRVSERNLRDGDLVAIGTARILFRETLEGEESAGKVVQHPSAPRLNCPTCQADYRKGDQFCRQCGEVVAPAPPRKAVCTSCGTVVPLPAKFCNACGQTLSPAAMDDLEITKPRAVADDPDPQPDPGPGPRDLPPPSPKPVPEPPVRGAASRPVPDDLNPPPHAVPPLSAGPGRSASAMASAESEPRRALPPPPPARRESAPAAVLPGPRPFAPTALSVPAVSAPRIGSTTGSTPGTGALAVSPAPFGS